MQEYEVLQAEMKRYIGAQEELVRLRQTLEDAVDKYCPKKVDGGYSHAVGESAEKLESVNREVITESAKQADICMDARKKIYDLLDESEPEEHCGNYTFRWTMDGLRVSWTPR
jgi:hypothetical protein